MMKRSLSILLILMMVFALPAQAGSLPFRDDVDAINQAAGSVLMLLVYQNREGSQLASGSGFVAFDSRTLITNYHVVAGGELVLAESDAGESFFLDQVIACSKEKDLAILRFKGDTGLAPLPLANDSALMRGQSVVAIGSPQGYKNTVSKGDISALVKEQGMDLIQFTAPISTGSSGGALFDNQGRVIGITSSYLGADSQNMNFAIDIREAIALYEQAGQPTPLARMDMPEWVQDGPVVPGPADVHFRGFVASQTGPDSVNLRWDIDAPEGTEYYIAYQVANNSHHISITTTEKEMDIDTLVPGMAYEFYLSINQDGLRDRQAKASLTLAEALPFAFRQAQLLQMGVYFDMKDHPFQFFLPEGLSALSLTELHQALSDKALDLIFLLYQGEAAANSKGSCLYVLTTPGGYTYTDAYSYEFGAEQNGYLRYADMEDLLQEVLDFEEGFDPGTWTFSVYLDGAILGSTAFEVVTDTELPPHPAAPGRNPAAYEGLPEVIPLQVGDEAFVGDFPRPYIDPDLINTHDSLAVTGFTLVYFAEDAGFNPLPFGDTGQHLTYFSFSQRVAPGQLINPGPVSLRQYGPLLHRMYVAVADIQLEDGSVIKLPMTEYEFSSWTVQLVQE